MKNFESNIEILKPEIIGLITHWWELSNKSTGKIIARAYFHGAIMLAENDLIRDDLSFLKGVMLHKHITSLTKEDKYHRQYPKIKWS
jgi:hypothetical protein